MATSAAIRVDEKGRLSIPAKTRHELGINPGDIFFFQSEGGILQYAKVEENPFEILAKHAIQECQEGKTISLEEYAEKHQTPQKPAKAKKKRRI